MKQLRQPTHPGVFLLKEVMPNMNIGVVNMAKALGVTRKTVRLITTGQQSVTRQMAVRIAHATSTSVGLWINMQAKHDIWVAENDHEYANEIKAKVTPIK